MATVNFLQIHQCQCTVLDLYWRALLCPRQVRAEDRDCLSDYLRSVTIIAVVPILIFAPGTCLRVMLVAIVDARIFQAAQGCLPGFMTHQAMGCDQVHVVGVAVGSYPKSMGDKPKSRLVV